MFVSEHKRVLLVGTCTSEGVLGANRLNYSARLRGIVAQPLNADGHCYHLNFQGSKTSHELSTSTESGSLESREITATS